MTAFAGSLDTNALLRYILNDVPKQTEAVFELLAKNSGQFAVADIAIVEVVFVLGRHYSFSRQQIAEIWEGLVSFAQINCNRALIEKALPQYMKHPALSFEDCCLAAYSELNNAEPLWTFDKKLANQVVPAQLIWTVVICYTVPNMQEVVHGIAVVIEELFSLQVEPVLTRTEEQFGDYATNVALQISKQLAKNPREVAAAIVEKLQHKDIAKVEVAGPGFINITLTDKALADMAGQNPHQSLAGKTVVAEYSDPNPFKVLHAGHLYTTITGDAIAKLLETAGAIVHRLNYGGDVGRHVGMTMWAIVKELGGENPKKLEDVDPEKRLEWLSARYVEGNSAYEKDETAKAQIIANNKRVYELHVSNDHDICRAPAVSNNFSNGVPCYPWCKDVQRVEL